MQVIEKIEAMQHWGEEERRQGRRLAFVPTMGFLHEGHLGLVRDAKTRGRRLVVSIFINPAQFAPGEDYAAYPRDFDRDRAMLEKLGVDVLFHPQVEDIYPEGFQTQVQVAKLSTFLCGGYRNGHFFGVSTVVAKLFNIVRPDVAVFGCKDYQQLQVIRRMTKDLHFPVEVIGHPTVRESDGLAMSSRNAYLDEAQREAAPCLWRSLRVAQGLVSGGERRAATILEQVRRVIGAEPLARLEYANLCDAETLEDVEELNRTAVLALAAWFGKARLIDNILLNP